MLVALKVTLPAGTLRVSGRTAHSWSVTLTSVADAIACLFLRLLGYDR